MEDDTRPDPHSEEDESDAGWYFDLPTGAWERQEAKNRELRQNVRRNIDEADPKRDVFGGPVRGGLEFGDDEIPEGWGAGGASHDDLVDARANRGDAAFDANPTEGEPPGDEAGAPAMPFALRSWRAPEEEPAALNPPPSLFGAESGDSVDEQPAPSGREIQDDAPAARRPRWDEVFGERDDELSMREGMRRWAGRSAPDADERPGAQASGASDDEDSSARVTRLPLRMQQHDEAVSNEEPEPETRWDQMFSRKSEQDGGLLDGMRSWASQRDEEPAPRSRLAPEPDDSSSADTFEPFDWQGDVGVPSREPIEFRQAPQDHSEKKGLFGKLFGRGTKDEQPAGPAPAAPRDRLAESDEPAARPGGGWLGRADGGENRFQAPRDSDWVPEEEASEAARSSGWSLAGDDDAPRPRFPRIEAVAGQAGSAYEDDEPVIGSALRGGLTDPAESWSPAPSTEDEKHFSDLSTWFANRNAASGAEAVASVPQDTATAEDLSGEPEAAVTGPAVNASPEVLDDAWSPEPFAPTGEPLVEPADALAGWNEPGGSEPVSAAPEHAGDEDPWASADALEESAQDAEPAAPSGTVGSPARFLAGPILAPDDEASEDESGDAWATFIRGRLSDDEAPSARVAAAADPAEPAAPTSGAFSGSNDVADADMWGDDEPAAPAPLPGERASLWDSAFEQIQDPLPDTVDDDPDADDQWAAIAPSAYEDDTAPDHEPPFDGDGSDDGPYAASPAHAATASFRADAPPTPRPAWDESEVDDDTVVRAFEAHAAMDRGFDPTLPPPSDDHLPFHELLGEDAEDIVAEASQSSVETRYFGRMPALAPQRSPGERQPYPWEQRDVPDAPRDGLDDHGTGEWEGLDPAPPWGGEPEAAVAAHSGAPSGRRKSRSRMLVREIVETGLLALLVFLSVRASFQNFKVDGYSMWPTLDDGEYLIVNKLAYAEVDMDRLGNFVPFVDPGDDPTREIFGGPERGDIVVLKDPRETQTDLIKRIIGMPGETLEIVDGKVYINDQLLVEPYVKEEWHDDKEKIAIPDGYYFVMGDNRNNSMDSRSSSIALIPKDLIIGKAMLTYWPRNRFGLAPNEAGDISEKDGRPVVTTERVPE